MRKQGKKQVWRAAGALLLSAVLALSAPVSYLPTDLEVYAAQADENGFVIEDGVLTKYTGTATEVVIPEGVKSIGWGAFQNRSTLTSIEIPSSVTSIDYGAFSGCSSLKSITIPSSVTSIEESAFWGCSGLTSITIPSGVTNIRNQTFKNCSGLTSIELSFGLTSIGSEAFYGCSGITSVTLPEGVTSIGGYAFLGCSSLESIEIPSSVTSIGVSAFSGCNSLTSISIPSGVTSIGDDAFGWCSGLESIVVVEEENTVYDSRENCNAIIESSSNTLIAGCKNTVIPSGVTSIGDDAFISCSGLESIEIPSSVTSIGRQAFYNCSGLTSIEIPSSVTSIGNWAFEGCGKLTIYGEEGSYAQTYAQENYIPFRLLSERGDNTDLEDGFVIENGVLKKYTGTATEVVIPKGVTSIGNYAFLGCSSLKSISIPSSVMNIGGSAFWGCSSLKSIVLPSGVTSIGDDAFGWCSGLESIVLPSGVTSIGWGAFSGCNSLKSITIPSSVTGIGDYAFQGCSSLESIVVEEGNEKYDSRNNCNAIIESSSNTLIAGCKNTVIPSGVTSIGRTAFMGCSGLTNISIPSSVTSIGNQAFWGCNGLKSISIPSSVMNIGSGAFCGCSSLTSISIPSSVTSIGGYAFSGCNLESIVVEEGNEKYDSRNNCNAIIESSSNALIAGCKNTVIPSGVTSIGDDAFQGCSSLMSISIPSSVTSIGGDAFSGCSGLTSIEIPSGVTSIGYNAFEGCSSLTSITIPKGVTSIGHQALYNCSGLTSIVVEKGNTVYDSRENCNAIIETKSNRLIAGCSKTVIPSSVTNIEDYAFFGCSNLESISIPSEVTSIGWGAFEGCSSLESISIPSEVTSIGWSAFRGCSSLMSIVVEKGNTVYDSRGNCNAIIESNSNRLIAGCSKTVIPSSVTSIGEGAFWGCSGLTSIEIPSSVTSIWYGAFYGCSGLTSIVVPSSVTSIRDTNDDDGYICAFYGCDKLTIYGEEGSEAQKYAAKYEIPFRLISEWNKPEIVDNILTSEKMAQLIEENKTKDTVFQTEDGLIFRFKKGTMELVEGVDSYDFGVEITEDYASLPNQDFTKEEFAFRIDYHYEGKLPGEAEITIPVGSKWAGKGLYYYEIKEDGTYSYVCRSTVKADGSYTVKQSHGGIYVATTKVPKGMGILGDADGDGKITVKDALTILMHLADKTPEDYFEEAADCDGTAGVTVSDALAILMHLADKKLLGS